MSLLQTNHKAENMKIEIHDDRNIYFPFELKDLFHEAFPNAKWNPTRPEWRVIKGAEQRLATSSSQVSTDGSSKHFP